MKVTYNINEKHFILRCEEKFPKKVFDTLTYIKEINLGMVFAIFKCDAIQILAYYLL